MNPNPHQIQAFYITPSARKTLGEECLEGAFNWQRSDPNLSRLTFGLPDPDLLNAWRDACADVMVEDFLILGPADQTPDFTEHPGLVDLRLFSAHEADTADMEALRGILHEPDEVFTMHWGDYGAGYHEGFVVPTPDDPWTVAFWTAYRDALKQYTGPVQGRSREEFATFVNRAWRCGLTRSSDLDSDCSDGQNVLFSLHRFPFCALVFNRTTGVWTTEGWLPDDLERVDPGGEIRRICEEEIL